MKKKKIGDNKGKYLVIDMTERQKRITQLKASLNSFSVDEYVIQAIDKFPINMDKQKCDSCNNDILINQDPYDYYTNIDGQEVTIKILNYPYFKCNSCNKELINLFSAKYLEDLLHFKILQSLKDDKKVPETIDLNELIKM